MPVVHWASLVTASPINRFLLIGLCSLCPIYCTQFNFCSDLLIFLEILPQYTSVQELHTPQTIIFTNEIRDTSLFLLLTMKNTETLRSKVLTIFKYSVWDSYNVFFQCKQHNTDFIKFKVHLLTSEVAMSTLSNKTAVFQVQYPENKYKIDHVR